jgi:hypothetical protein
VKTLKIDVLGTEYEIKICTDDEECRLCGCDGFCDETSKEIFAESYAKTKSDPNCKLILSVQTNKVVRHEIIHAFLFESGLAENSEWAQNEEMVDWFAIQMPKLLKAFGDADCL